MSIFLWCCTGARSTSNADLRKQSRHAHLGASLHPGFEIFRAKGTASSSASIHFAAIRPPCVLAIPVDLQGCQQENTFWRNVCSRPQQRIVLGKHVLLVWHTTRTSVAASMCREPWLLQIVWPLYLGRPRHCV